MKKLLVFLMALAMMVTCVPFAAVAETEEPVTLDIFYRTSSEIGATAEAIHQYVIDNLGIDMNVIAGSDNYQQELALLITGGNVPDIIARLSQALFLSYAEEGVFYDISGLLNEETYPGIYRYLNSVQGYTIEDALARTTIDGAVYGMPSVTIARSYYSNNIRTDWLENLGLEMPTTLEEFRNVMYEFTYGDPDGDGVDDTYGFNARGGYYYFNPFFGAFGTRPDEAYSLNAAGEVVTGVLSENYKAALTWLAEAYADGLIDPESFTQNSTEWNEKWARDEFGYTCGWWEAAGNVIPYGFSGTLDVIYPPVGENGMTGVIAQDPCESFLGIGYDTEHIEECMKLIDFLMSDYGHRTLMQGIEGRHWTWNEDQTAFGAVAAGDVDFQGYEMGGLMQYYRFVYDIGIENETFALMIPEAETEADKYRLELLVEGTQTYPSIPVIENLFVGLNTNELTTYGSDLSTYVKECGTKFINGEMSIEDDWGTYVSTYLSMGGEEVRNSLLAAYNAWNGTELVFAADAA